MLHGIHLVGDFGALPPKPASPPRAARDDGKVCKPVMGGPWAAGGNNNNGNGQGKGDGNHGNNHGNGYGKGHGNHGKGGGETQHLIKEWHSQFGGWWVAHPKARFAFVMLPALYHVYAHARALSPTPDYSAVL